MLSCFKAYDIRGRAPDELNENIAYGVGLAYARQYHPRRVTLGRDVRTSRLDLENVIAHGLVESSVDVLEIGLCGPKKSISRPSNPVLTGAIW